MQLWKSTILESNSKNIEFVNDVKTEPQKEHVKFVILLKRVLNIEAEPQVEHDEFICGKKIHDKVDLAEHIDFVIPKWFIKSNVMIYLIGSHKCM